MSITEEKRPIVQVPTEPMGAHDTRTTAELSPEERAHIVKQAGDLAQGLRDRGIVRPADRFPVHVYDAIEKLGISVQEAPLHALGIKANGRLIAGAILKMAGEDYPTIFVEETGTAQHKLFTASHELAHYLLWCEGVPAEARKNVLWGEVRPEHTQGIHGDQLPSEYAANTFAQLLLMPDQEFISQLQEKKSLADVANYFGVSEESATRRLSYYDLESQTV